MIDEETLAQINGKYVCPPNAGPACRAAQHQPALNLVLEAIATREGSQQQKIIKS